VLGIWVQSGEGAKFWLGVLTELRNRGVRDRQVGALPPRLLRRRGSHPRGVAAHPATSSLWYRDSAKIAATLTDLDTAPIEEPLRATLRMLGKLTHEHSIDTDDIRTALAAGVSPQQIKDALAVCLAFDITARLANAFDFAIATPAAIDAGAQYLLKRGYR
jgi:hypothetical protein